MFAGGIADIWLETIASNAGILWVLLPTVLDSPHVFDAGWNGAAWKSFADAVKQTLPYLDEKDSTHLSEKILRHWPEIDAAIALTKTISSDGESVPWNTRSAVIYRLNASGHNQGGRRATDLHQIQEIIKREYASSENDPALRHRLLDLVDKMLSFELYGTDEILRAHER